MCSLFRLDVLIENLKARGISDCPLDLKAEKATLFPASPRLWLHDGIMQLDCAGAGERRRSLPQATGTSVSHRMAQPWGSFFKGCLITGAPSYFVGQPLRPGPFFHPQSTSPALGEAVLSSNSRCPFSFPRGWDEAQMNYSHEAFSRIFLSSTLRVDGGLCFI